MSQEEPPAPGSPGEPSATGTAADIEIRVARPEELRAIGELTATVYVAAGYISPNGGYVPHLRDAAARARDAELIVATRHDEPIGTVTYCRYNSSWAQLAGPDEAEFRMLAVNPKARGLGLGEALVRYCIQRAREDGCTTLRLSTEPVMHAAHRIYRRLGFVRTPDRDWSPTPGGELLTYALAL